MRVKEHKPPKTLGILGNVIDATTLPESHLACARCSGFKFEVSGFPGGSKMELGCIACNERFYIAFPTNCSIPEGRFICKRHPNKAMIVIHNVETVCVGCEACKTEMHIVVKDKGGLILADG
jgi:hypothetical protein